LIFNDKGKRGREREKKEKDIGNRVTFRQMDSQLERPDEEKMVRLKLAV
jgi:hypothetical protein